MSRVTAPIAKLARATVAGASAAPVGRPAHSAGAVLSPKYEQLLSSRRSSEHADSSRGLSTTHRPTPQPSLANRARPLMQTFHSTVAPAASHHLDAAVIPSMSRLAAEASSADAGPRVPLLPDNYAAAHGPMAGDAPVQLPEISIVAANPDTVAPATALSEVEGIGVDGVELKFAHEDRHRGQPDEASRGMIRDLWKGMVEDVLGPANRNF